MTATDPDRPQAEAEITEALRLRPDPPRVMRLSRKAIAAAATIGGLGLGAILIVALQNNREADPRTELFTTDRIPQAEGLSRLPGSYADVPRLGPPLPGYLGRPTLAAQDRGVAVPIGPVMTGPGPVDPDEQRRLQEIEAARLSALFAEAQTVPRGGAPVSPSPAAPGLFPALAKGLLWGGGVFTALLTAFYMFRLYYLTFEGEPRWAAGQRPHEPPGLMRHPLWVLAGLSAVGGFLGFGHWTGLPNWLHGVMEPVLHPGALVAGSQHLSLGLELALVAVAILAGVGGLLWARAWYGRPSEAPALAARRWPRLHALAVAKWRVDEIYEALFVAPYRRLCEWAGTFDRWVVDGLVEGAGVGATLTGEVLRHVSSGRVRTYALSVFLGAVGIAVWLLVH